MWGWKPRKVEIYPTDLSVGMMGLEPAVRGIYASLCATILHSGEPVGQYGMERRCGCKPAALRKALAVLLEHRLVEISGDGAVSIGWCLEAARKARARPEHDEWSRLRVEVFERDNYTCRYCGQRGGTLECDHVVPASRGGVATLENLVTACRPCNREKRNRTPEEWAAAQ